MSRMENTFKNAKYSLLSQFLSLILTFVSKTVFLKVLGATYSGVGGLYGNILGVLSLAEMGFSSAMAFALYKPTADNDIEKLKSLMYVYKKVYRIIAVIIAVLGLCLSPFLKYIINGGEVIGYDRLTIYYYFFLFDTVSSYFVSYKYSIIYAEQKGYIYTNINLIWTFINVTIKTIGLLLTKSYLVYLSIGIVINILQKIYMNVFINKKYEYLKDTYCQKLSKEETASIKKNVKALIFHNIGGKMVNQTDNIIISAFINITVAGYMSFYTMVMNAVNSVINTILSAAVSSIGNVVAKESVEKQKAVIDKYVFVNSYISGFACVGFFILLSPFVELMWGKELLIPDTVVFFLVFSVYLSYQLNCINNIKSAAGIFDEDKYIPLLQSIINLVVSVALAKKIGLAGVYIGTVTQGAVALICKVLITYKTMFNTGIIEYTKWQLLYLILVTISSILCMLIKNMIFAKGVSALSFIIMFIIVCATTNIIFLIGLWHKKETKFYIDLFKGMIKKCTHI